MKRRSNKERVVFKNQELAAEMRTVLTGYLYDVTSNPEKSGNIDMEALQKKLDMNNKRVTFLVNYRYKLFERSDGYWQTTNAYGDKPRKVKAKTREELIDRLIDLKKKAEDKSNQKTVDQVYEEWLQEYKVPTTGSANTIRRHRQHYERYLAGTDLFKKEVKDVNRLELEVFCNQLVCIHSMSSKEYTNVKTILRGLFQYAFEKGYIEKNPMKDVRITVKFRQVVTKTGATETFNTAERKRFFRYLDKHYEETKDLSFLAVKVNFYLGLRIGELVALKWKDIIDPTQMHVEREEVVDQDTRVTSVVNHTKTSTDRFVAVVPKSYEIFNEIWLHGDTIPEEEDFVFKRNGERLRARQVAYVYDKYGERIGVRKSSHKTRKSYASILNENGVPVDAIRNQLGHSNLATTYKYIFDSQTNEETYDDIKAALDKLDKC